VVVNGNTDGPTRFELDPNEWGEIRTHVALPGMPDGEHCKRLSLSVFLSLSLSLRWGGGGSDGVCGGRKRDEEIGCLVGLRARFVYTPVRE
jgi:hypothetical protein